MIVADSNLTVYLYVEGPHTQEAQAVLRREPVWVVPPLWQSEFLNVMWLYVRQGTFSVEDALRRYYAAARLVQVIETPPAHLVLRLATDHNCSAYDSTYAALARHHGIQHLTYDTAVLKAGLGVHPRDFLRTR